MTQQQANNTIKVAGIVLSMAVFAAGVVFALGSQNMKLNSYCLRVEAAEARVDLNRDDVTSLKADMKYLIKSVDEISKEVKK